MLQTSQQEIDHLIISLIAKIVRKTGILFKSYSN